MPWTDSIPMIAVSLASGTLLLLEARIFSFFFSLHNHFSLLLAAAGL
ncbi:MAG: hypothetical protein ACOYOE_01250 [Chlorobium sp.]